MSLLFACAAALQAFQAVQPPAAPEKCTLEGRVVNAATGEPLNKTSVVLLRADGPKTAAGLPQAFSTATDANGRFAMKDIDPGGYRLRVSRSGFVTTEYGARRLTGTGTTLPLASGREVKDIAVRLTPHGVVAGRILDEDGEPVTSVTVQVLKMQYANGKKQLQTNGSATTNDLGEYRVFGMAPGKYYVSATLQAITEASLIAVDRSVTPRPQENYVPTYYPGTSEAPGAVPVEIVAGSPTRGIDMTLAKRRTFSVKGRVTPAGMLAILSPRSLSGPLSLRMVRLDPKGEFEIQGVAPGAYSLSSSARVGSKTYSASMPLEVASANVEGVNLAIGPGFAVSGRLRVDGETKEDLAKVQVRLQAREMNMGTVLGAMGSAMAGGTPGESSGKLEQDLTFRLEDVSADRYDLRVTGLPDGFYVKSVHSGETDVMVSGLDVVGGAQEPLAIVVSPQAGLVSGSVQNSRTQQPEPDAVVVLVPQEKERREVGAYYQQAAAGRDGTFTFKNLPPGAYKVYAWEDVESGAWMDADFMKPLESMGEAVTLKEGAKETVQVKAIAAEQK